MCLCKAPLTLGGPRITLVVPNGHGKIYKKYENVKPSTDERSYNEAIKAFYGLRSDDEARVLGMHSGASVKSGIEPLSV